MLDAKKMSEAIRSKRKKIREEGVENMIDTAPGPQMNPQDILNLKHEAQIKETLGTPDQLEAPCDPANASLSDPDGSTQEKSELKKKMDRVEKVFNKLSM